MRKEYLPGHGDITQFVNISKGVVLDGVSSESQRLVDILGVELAQLLRARPELDQTLVFTVGAEARLIQQGLYDQGLEVERAHHYGIDDLVALAAHLRELSPPALLVKGSRSIRLERLLPLLDASRHSPS